MAALFYDESDVAMFATPAVAPFDLLVSSAKISHELSAAYEQDKRVIIRTSEHHGAKQAEETAQAVFQAHRLPSVAYDLITLNAEHSIHGDHLQEPVSTDNENKYLQIIVNVRPTRAPDHLELDAALGNLSNQLTTFYEEVGIWLSSYQVLWLIHEPETANTGE